MYKREKPTGAPVTYNVLIVEDNADDVELFLRVLRKVDVDLEINAHSVSNSMEAAAQIKEQKFDAIFLDIGMPPPDGIELTKQIRHSATNQNTTVLIITGAEDRGLMTRAFQAGANFFLSKPIDRTQLLRLIEVSRVPIDRERRRLQRVKVKCKVSIESDQSRFDGETVDLSLSGISVRASRVLPVGSIANVTVTLTPASSMRVIARTVRVVENDFMGLEFERIGQAEHEKLAAFLVPLVVAAVEENRPSQV
jgi:CheY-like chemotaxis protein